MNELNDDCLVSIFKHVPELRDQVRLAQTCRRFEAILRCMWLHQNRYKTLNLVEWRGWLADKNDFSYFFDVIKDVVLTIVVGDETLSQFLHDMQHLLALKKRADGENICSLINVQHFVDEEKTEDNLITDYEMKLLVQLLPNLVSLHVKEPLNGRYVSNFNKLEELYLYVPSEKPFEIDNTYFKEICSGLKKLRVLDVRCFDGKSLLNLEPVLGCQNLTVLKVNLNPLKHCLQEVLKLPKLACLNVMLDFEIDVSSIQNVDTHDYKIYETEEFYDILKSQSERIIGLSIDLYYFPLPGNWPLHLDLWQGGRSYTKFSLCNCDFSANPLIDYANTMNSLEILCFRNWQLMTNDHILNFVKYCPQLQHLDVSYCSNIDGKLIYQILNILKKLDRKQPLYLYYLLSGLEEEVKKLNLQTWDGRNLIKLSADFPYGTEKGLSSVYRGYEFIFICNNAT